MDEYFEHLRAGRTGEAANCQREAVFASGVRQCPAWAAPAIPEVGFSDADIFLVRSDVQAYRLISRDRKRAGLNIDPIHAEYSDAKSRLAAMET